MKSYAQFHGGPADGLGLALPLDRAPFYLRVAVEGMVGECAVLSGSENAGEDEAVAVYVRPGEVLRQVKEPGGRPVIAVASYVFLPDVYGDELRGGPEWARWALAQPPAGAGRVGETVWEPPADPPAPTAIGGSA